MSSPEKMQPSWSALCSQSAIFRLEFTYIRNLANLTNPLHYNKFSELRLRQERFE